MKKVLFMMALAVFVMFGCHKKENCQQPYSSEEIPELVSDDYNTCEAINKNFSYRACDGKLSDFPYWSYEGDSIKICGYFDERWNGDDLFLLWDYPDNQSIIPSFASEHSQDYIYIYAGQLPDSIDISKKCYIDGVLGFTPQYTSFGSYLVLPNVFCDGLSIRFE